MGRLRFPQCLKHRWSDHSPRRGRPSSSFALANKSHAAPSNPAAPFYTLTRSTYWPVRVSILITLPILMKIGCGELGTCLDLDRLRHVGGGVSFCAWFAEFDLQFDMIRRRHDDGTTVVEHDRALQALLSRYLPVVADLIGRSARTVRR